MKYLRFCSQDISDDSWDMPVSFVNYCIGSVTLISDFVDYLQNDVWKVGYSGVIGYMN